MIVAQQCGTAVLHRPVRAPEGSELRALTQCGQPIEYGAWGLYELKGKHTLEVCKECWK